MSGGALHQDEMGGGRGEDGATYSCRVNGVAGERREEGARKRPTRRHCALSNHGDGWAWWDFHQFLLENRGFEPPPQALSAEMA